MNPFSYSTKTDIQSFCVTAYLLIYGTFPYMPNKPSVKNMKTTIGLGHPAPTFRPSQMCDGIKVSDSAGHYERLLLQREPSLRPSAKNALKHKWLAMANSTPKSSLPSLQPMLSNAGETGALDSKRKLCVPPLISLMSTLHFSRKLTKGQSQKQRQHATHQAVSQHMGLCQGSKLVCLA